jgi:solute:Na+ symporter, SSS family
VLTFQLPGVAGIGQLLESSREHFGWPWERVRLPVFLAWMLALFINQFFAMNSMAEGAARYLMVRDCRQARYTAGLLAILILIAPVLLLLPPLALAVSGADLTREYSQLTRPEEAAYVATSLRLLPQGMMGLLVSAIFAATMSTMDSALNRNAGIFSLNVFKVWIRPEASEKQLLVVGKVFTLVFGLLVIGIAIFVHYFRTMGLFDLVILVVASVSLPLVIPLFYGLFIRSAPAWAGWTTTLCGFLTAQFIRWGLDLERLAGVMSSEPLSAQELIDARYALTVFGVFAVSSSWFLLASILNRRSRGMPSPVRSFYADLAREVDAHNEGIEDNAAVQYAILSTLCLVYGGFILSGILIPNSFAGRACFLFAGFIMLGIGCILRMKIKSQPVQKP